jgi:hypothetical protein
MSRGAPLAGRARAAACALLVLLLLLASTPPARAASDLLPDLAMAPLRDVRVQSAGGRQLLRFTAEIVNLGAGPFELTGTRPSTADPLITTVTQRVLDDAGGARTVGTPAVMEFAGDGHSHWHVRDLERYELLPLDGPDTLGLGAKQGFCFFDNNRYQPGLPGHPSSPVYLECGGPADTSVTMGLSVGWGDVYGWDLPGQFIDITGLPPGAYRLRAVANPEGWFEEQRRDNNDTTLVILWDGRQAWEGRALMALPLVLSGAAAQP